MKKETPSWTEKTLALLFAPASPEYAQLAFLLLVVGGICVFGLDMPVPLRIIVQLLVMLASSRVFSSGALRTFWLVCVSCAIFTLLLYLVPV